MDEIIKLKDFVPFFQTLLWVLLIIVSLIIFRKRVLFLIDLLQKRISQGSSFKVAGIELGEELKKFDKVEMEKTPPTTLKNGNEKEEERIKIYENTRGVFLTHLLFPSEKQKDNFDIFIYLIRHNINNFDDIEYVEFFFGHMWGNKVYRETLKNGYFGISVSAYKPFLCTCKIKFVDKETTIYRYIDFEIIKLLK